ncbi:hypothetical protein GUITHDRAFT_54507, partial [Guillardia theta CCMP2712]
NQLGQEGSEHVAACLQVNQHVTRLNMGGNKIGDDGLRKLASCFSSPSFSLQHLQLYSNNISDVGGRELLESLRGSTSLRSLDLAGNLLSCDCLLGPELALPSQLTSLSLAHNLLADAGAEALARCARESSSLTRIDVSGNFMGEEARERIRVLVAHNVRLRDL